MSTTLVRRTLAAVSVLLLVGLGGSLPALAQSGGRSVTWQRFDADLDMQRDGSVVVGETQAIQFTGTYQQGYRLVPLDRTTGVTDVQVAEIIDGRPVAYTRGTGRPNTYSSSVGAGGLQIDWWFPPTTNAARVFFVRYTASGAVRIYEGGDQFQWRAIYADRDGAVGASTIAVHLPADADPAAVQSAWYEYQAGRPFGGLSQVASGTRVDGRTVRFTLGHLAPRTGAEVRVQFPHGLVSAAPPAWQADADRADWLAQTVAPIGTFLSLLLTLGILGGGAAFLFGLWANHGRDPAVGSVPPRLREPPSDLPAPLAGTLVDEVASQKEVVAAVVDMADRGLVQLTDVQTPQLVGSGSDVRIRLQVGLDDARVRGYERALLAALFGSSPTVPAEVLLSSVKAQFQSSIPSIDARLYDAVTQQGLFARNPETIRRLWLGIGTAVIMVGIVLAVGAGVALGGAVPIAFLPGAALVVLGVALVVLAGSMPRRTRQGALEAAKWRAFRAFLADASRAERSGTALPPHYLPYAVAFGVDEAFVRHLESVGTPPPAWFGRSYGGPGGVVFLPGGWYGGPWMGPRPHDGGAAQPHDGQPGAGGIAAPAAPDPQGWSDALAGLLNAASEAMAHGGGSGGWSGGGFGGGGGGGGGSGGFR